MSAMASQIISLTIVYSTVYSGTDQRKHQSSASLAFVRGIRRGPVNSPHKGPVTRKMFHLMTSSWLWWCWCVNHCRTHHIFPSCWSLIHFREPLPPLNFCWAVAKQIVQCNHQHQSFVINLTPAATYRCFQPLHRSIAVPWIIGCIEHSIRRSSAIANPQTQEHMSARWVSMLCLMANIWRAGSLRTVEFE